MADRRTTGKTRNTSTPASKPRTGVSRRPSQGQKAHSKNSGTRAANRKARSGSHASASTKKQSSAKQKRQPSFVGSGGRTGKSRASTRSHASLTVGNKQSGSSAAIASVAQRIVSSKTALIVVGVIVLVLLLAVFDGIANNGKAYGHVSINGMDVSGMTSDEMKQALEKNFGSKVSGSRVTVYASEEARQKEAEKNTQRDDEAIAEQISVEDANAKITSWTADSSTLKATLPYDEAINEALEAGRRGGPFARIYVAIAGEDVPLSVSYDDASLDAFASDIDKTVGDPRVDATVKIENGNATVVNGHEGNMVDRTWLAEKLSNVMLEKDGSTYIIAEATKAPSRTTDEQAQAACDAINKAIKAGAQFTYKNSNWNAGSSELGSWTRVDVVDNEGKWELKPSIDQTAATSALVKHVSSAGATTSTDGIAVDFETDGNNVTVKTSGTGEIPEVVPAIQQINDALYGEQGIAFSAQEDPQPVQVSIGESNAPETLSFDQAVDLGIITVIGEYTTEFSNESGTENRNHNIRLVSDMLNNTVCESDGGQWSFNEHTGDTNLDPPFASAGSIVNGEYVDSIGGGICQVATTIFNAVYEAGLDVVERRNHSLYIASYPTGRDVGVSYPELDFIWANKLPSDVLLTLSYTDTTVTAKVYGVYTGYKVETTVGEWEAGSKYKTEFEVDDTLAKDDYYLKTVGEDGTKISVVRKVTDKSGNLVSEADFSSVYEPKNEVYLVGPGTDTSKLSESSEERRRESSQDSEDGGDSDGESLDSESSSSREESDGSSDDSEE